jgi:uncharacterized protein (TIRG00374 family)
VPASDLLQPLFPPPWPVKQSRCIMQKTIKSHRRLLGIGLKICVSLLFLAYLFDQVEWDEVWRHLRGAHVPYLLLYVFLGFVVIVINSIKWRVLSGARGIRPPLSYMVSLYLVGYFFSNFLPTSMGGDLVRGYVLGKAYGKPADAMASVFVERFTGYTALVLFGMLAIAFDQKLRTDMRLVAPIAVAALAYVGILWMILSASWLRLAQKWFPVKIIQKFLAKIGTFQQAIYLYKHEPKALLVAGGWSILFYFLSVVMVSVGCLTFYTTVSFTSLLTAVPVLLILFMVPFSLGGIGLQEWAYYFVLATVGVPAPVSLSLGLLFRTRSVVFGLVGGAIYPFATRAAPVILEEPSIREEKPSLAARQNPAIVRE